MYSYTSTPPLGLCGLFWGELYLYLYHYHDMKALKVKGGAAPRVLNLEDIRACGQLHALVV